MVVQPAGQMGMGAFAAAPIAKGAWLGTYQGELTTYEESVALYAGADNRTDYIMCMSKARNAMCMCLCLYLCMCMCRCRCCLNCDGKGVG